MGDRPAATVSPPPMALADAAWPAKFWPRSTIMPALAGLPRPWVFTNGVFDILHRGHVQYLEQAHALGATLIVGVNSDPSARLLGKGPDRPLNCDVDRVWVLAALAAVSIVTLFDEPTPLDLIEQIQPDIYVKGGDYDVARLPEAELMARWGGLSLALPFRDGYATTALVQRIRGEPLRRS